MPNLNKKRKSQDSDSDSDSSGPDDRVPVKKNSASSAKKTSAAPPSKNAALPEGSTAERDDDGNPRWHLDSKKFVTVRAFKGKTYIDIREFYDAKGELKPGKKGIAMNMQQWNQFKQKIDDIDHAMREAV